MYNYKEFGECLRELLDTFKIKSSVLAKGINVDSSLVYKWLRGTRTPSYSSPYVELITNFFVKNIVNSHLKKSIVNKLLSWGFKVSESDELGIENAIRTALLEAQGYSIESDGNKKNTDRKKYYKKKGYDGMSKELFSGYERVKIIKGNRKILIFTLKLLNMSLGKSVNTSDAILISSNSYTDLLRFNHDLCNEWKCTLYKILQKGWKIIYLVRLDNNIERTLRIVEDIQFALSTGRYFIYYKKSAEVSPIEILPHNEILIIPQIGALYSFPSENLSQIDSAFFFQSKASVNLLKGHFFQLFSSAQPLLKPYPSHKSTKFQKALTEIEEVLGNSYVISEIPCTITIPIELYEKYLEKCFKTSCEISERINLHKRRIDAYNVQINYYKYRHICFKESIENFVNKKKYPLNGSYHIFKNNSPNNMDIRCHLSNVISLMENHSNYELAIISKEDYKNITQLCWEVKKNYAVLIETCVQDDLNQETYNYDSQVNFVISEKEVVNAFQYYHEKIWDYIPEKNKDKTVIITWLNSLIADLSEME